MRIGISGWSYPPWRGDFYPEGLPQARELEYAARAAQHDRDQRLVLLAAAADELPRLARADAGRLRVRGQGRALHHAHEEARRRRDAAGELLRVGRARARRRSSGRSSGSSRRRWRFDAERLADVLRRCCPRTTTAAAELAARHDERRRRPRVHERGRRAGRSATPSRSGTPGSGRRRSSTLLREHDVAVVVADTAGQAGRVIEDVTADFVYVRLHGDERALRQRLHRRGARRVGRAHPALGATTAATSSSTSTTTRRCAHRSTR